MISLNYYYIVLWKILERERGREQKSKGSEENEWKIKIKWIKKLNIWFKLGVWKMPRKIKWHKRRKQEKVFFYSHHNIKYNDDKDKTDSFMELFGSVYLI